MIDPKQQQFLRTQFNPDDSNLRKHQLRMLDMLRYIDAICRKHNIEYWLSSGTLLGAVRHGGFIPWDDDVDIEMMREDYERFVKVIKEDENPNYILQTHDSDPNYYWPFGKLRDLHSEQEELNITYNQYYKYRGIFVDVFVMEYSSSYILSKLTYGVYLYFVYKIVDSKMWRHKWIRSTTHGIYTCLIKIVYPLLRIWNNFGSKEIIRHTLGMYLWSERKTNEIFPLKELSFEGYDFFVPQDSNAYLKRLFGDYMTLPSVEQIHPHTGKITFLE